MDQCLDRGRTRLASQSGDGLGHDLGEGAGSCARGDRIGGIDIQQDLRTIAARQIALEIGRNHNGEDHLAIGQRGVGCRFIV